MAEKLTLINEEEKKEDEEHSPNQPTTSVCEQTNEPPRLFRYRSFGTRLENVRIYFYGIQFE